MDILFLFCYFGLILHTPALSVHNPSLLSQGNVEGIAQQSGGDALRG